MPKSTPKPVVATKFTGKGTRARLNTAAEKMFFRSSNYSVNNKK